MDAHRFDRVVKSLHSRRAALGLAGIGALLLSGIADEAEAKCKKKCGPCKRCKNGKCQRKLGPARCGPCSYCDLGTCRRSCSPEDCVDDGEGEVCLRA